MRQPILVCSDRDGTVNRDENYYLGSDADWKNQLEFLPYVLAGVRLLNEREIIPVIVTNQSGVALGLLNEARMHEVNRHVIDLASGAGSHFGGYVACPYVDEDYAKKATAKGRRLIREYVRDGHPDIKPRIGMLEQAAALQFQGQKLEECRVYVIGDRLSDVELGLNGGGVGILIESPKTRELGDLEKAKGLQERFPGRVHISTDYFAAAQIILSLICSAS